MFFRPAVLILVGFPFFVSAHEANELGVGYGPTYLKEEASWATSLHIHYLRHISEKVGMGLGYESIFDEHGHQVVSLVFRYKLATTGLKLSYMPGVYLQGGSGVAHHFEVSWSTEIGNIHAGPFLSVSFSDETHYSLGLHVGAGF